MTKSFVRLVSRPSSRSDFTTTAFRRGNENSFLTHQFLRTRPVDHLSPSSCQGSAFQLAALRCPSCSLHPLHCIAALSLVPSVVEAALHFVSRSSLQLVRRSGLSKLHQPCHKSHNVQHCIRRHGLFCFLRVSCWLPMVVSQSASCLAPLDVVKMSPFRLTQRNAVPCTAVSDDSVNCDGKQQILRRLAATHHGVNSTFLPPTRTTVCATHPKYILVTLKKLRDENSKLHCWLTQQNPLLGSGPGAEFS